MLQELNMKSLVIFAVTCLVATYIRSPRAATPIAGPFDIVIKSGNICEDMKELTSKTATFDYKVNRYSRNNITVLFTNVTINVPVDDEIKGIGTLAVKTSQGWKDNFFTYDAGGVCTAGMRFLPAITKSILKQVGYTRCPVPPGNYPSILVKRSGILLVDTFFYNDYKGRGIAKRRNKVIACVEGYFSIVPRKRKRF